MDSQNEIPAFGMWQMFNDTMPALMNIRSYNENHMQRLANIIELKEFSNIFVFNPDPSLTYAQYQEMALKYKAFTIWLLGRFFNLLSAERLSRLHNLLTDAQLRILQCIAIKERSVYNELVEDYTFAFGELINCFKERKFNTKLTIFVPPSIPDLQDRLDLSANHIEVTSKESLQLITTKAIIIISDILVRNIMRHNLKSVYENLDNVLYLLKNENISLKLAALHVYISIVTKNRFDTSGYPLKLLRKMDEFLVLLEQLTYNLLGEILSMTDQNLELLCSVLIQVIDSYENQMFMFERLQNMSCFIFKILNNKNKTLNNINDEIKTGLWSTISKLLLQTTNIISSLTKENELILDISGNERLAKLSLMKKEILLELKRFTRENSVATINVFDASSMWCRVRSELEKKCLEPKCNGDCLLLSKLDLFEGVVDMIAAIKVEYQTFLTIDEYKPHVSLTFFDESVVVVLGLTLIFEHVDNCNIPFPTTQFLKLFSKLHVSYIPSNLYALAILILGPLEDIDSALLTKTFFNNRNYAESLRKIRKQLNGCKDECWQSFVYFTNYICSGIVDTEKVQEEYEKILNIYMKHSIHSMKTSEKVPRYLTNILSSFNQVSPNNSLRLLEALHGQCQKNINNSTYLDELQIEYKKLYCATTSVYYKILKWSLDKNLMEVDLYCLHCEKTTDINEKIVHQKRDIVEKYGITNVAIYGPYENEINPNLEVIDTILFNLFNSLTKNGNNNSVIQLLAEVAKHSLKYHTNDFYKDYKLFMNSENKNERIAFSNVSFEVISNTLNHKQLDSKKKKIILTDILKELKEVTWKSLKKSDYELQETVIQTLENISTIKNEDILLSIIDLLLCFIMVPTSKHSLIAVNVFIQAATYHKSGTSLLYQTYKEEICNRIVNMCCLNLKLLNYNLCASLERVSLVLGFFGTKDFVTQEHQNLLPYFVPAAMKMPKATQLIEEMAMLAEQELHEILTSKYGNIFIYIFLNETEEIYKKSMKYLEENSGLSGPVLRKKNFMVLLNELLLNFNEKKDRVLLALKLLFQEESNGQHVSVSQVPDFLQKRFLGVLQYFDTKLLSRDSHKKKVLLSLAQIMEQMGPKRIAPLRFKIIAMLRTALTFTHGDFPQLNCDVWNTFVRCCDLEALGPQVATIFISILPLLKKNPAKVNGIFRYLVVENEEKLQNYMLDLFFAVDTSIDYEIILVIKKNLEIFEKKSFKEQLKMFIKYLTHETMEIRVHGLKYLKKMLEKNREELDQMVLGYNGIDSIIVELLDILTLGCREKDESLKMACGECIGELGAVEPSHLPRRYTQDSTSFTFFITEDNFIMNSLLEFTRAMQAEKNTQNIDRYSLAIQETLKTYEISPDVGSARHHLWNMFPEAQKELMLPLLSSRYTMVQPGKTSDISPIYGSTVGSTFQSWLYNWACSMISTLKPDKRSILQVYQPSLKQDYKTMMHFLPHILLQSLLEGEPIDQKKIENEMMAVINSFNNKPELDPKILSTRPLITSNVSFTPKPKVPETIRQNQSMKVVFILLDFLERWTREFEWQKGSSARLNKDYKIISNFKKQFCKLQLAKVNYECGEYPRALMYLEDFIMENLNDLNDHLYFLSEIYAHLNESDGVAGVTASQQTEPPLEQKILALEVSGKLGDAVAFYERMSHPLKLNHLQGLLQCYLDLDSVNTALNLARGALEKQMEYTKELLELQAEPFWRLGRWDDLDDLLKKPELQKNTTWGVQIGKALLCLKDGKRNGFQNVIDFLRKQQVDGFGATSLEAGAYQQGYNYITKLHILTELEHVEKVIYELLLRPNDQNVCEGTMKKLIHEWELRIKVVQESVKIIEPILCLRRVALDQAKTLVKDKAPHSLNLIDSLLGESWLLSAKTARAAGFHQQAYTYTLKAEEYAPPRLFLEKAKLHWMREEHEQAITTLRRGLEQFLPDTLSASSNNSLSNLTVEQRKICAEAKLLIASYNDSTSNVDTDVNMQHYKEAMEMFKEWEKSFVCLAQYYDRIFQTFSDEDRDAKGSDMQLHMINYFGKSLQYGTNYVYQSMPRLLSIWFDYGTRLLDVTVHSQKEERKAYLLKMTKLIDAFLNRLPSFIFLTAFSQLVSRICHPQKEVYIELKSIIIKLILQYPQQSLWMIIPVIKSSYAVRKKRCEEILNDSRLKTPTMTKFIGDFTKLAEKLIELCNKEISDNVATTSVGALLRTLPRMLTKEGFSEIMMPTQKFRKLVLPNSDFKTSQHNPFPNHYVHIIGIVDEIQILPSLQRPRKIRLKGSDGKEYIQMLKPKDDLRKDFRLMEFNDIVNQLLSREAESRQRRLNIRLYSVAPLNEECGLIEWVPNLVGLRPILTNLYKHRELGMKGKELKENICNQRDTFSHKKTVFLTKLLPRHPPILGEWFRKTFPDAQSWLTARTAYTRTTAVISMVGYMLGLGDRHGENILLDATCGDTVHVDFNCLFNKGESFEWPERVPFRLTHNMVAAMGPLGVEGVFRISCACTLRVLRTNITTLMSIVTPFVYDPLVSWPRYTALNANSVNAERTNEQAVEHIRNIKLRLQGMVRTKGRSFSIPLSVEGQTNNLIQEAMSIDNLCQMYIGWGPYL